MAVFLTVSTDVARWFKDLKDHSIVEPPADLNGSSWKFELGKWLSPTTEAVTDGHCGGVDVESRQNSFCSM